MVKGPCKDCGDRRTIGVNGSKEDCHSTCVKYADFKAGLEMERALKKKYEASVPQNDWKRGRRG